jgi:translation initiation factor 1
MADEPRFNNPFAALLKGTVQAKDAPPQHKPEPAPPVVTEGRSSTGKIYARAVVRMERSGRGGKEVTVVEQLALAAAERDEWLKALKASLGCGGVVEGDNLVLQGDHRKRLPRILTSRGVKKIILSN